VQQTQTNKRACAYKNCQCKTPFASAPKCVFVPNRGKLTQFFHKLSVAGIATIANTAMRKANLGHIYQWFMEKFVLTRAMQIAATSWRYQGKGIPMRIILKRYRS
jgi:hypothetical protein